MKDYSRQDAGASIVMATSVDDRFPPENILVGAESFGAEAIGTFWMTTGMYPQEVVIALAKPVQVSQLVIMMLNVKKLSVEKCDSDKPTNFEKVFESELQSREGRLQTERHQVNIKAKYIKLILHSGYAEFAAVNRVSVIGAGDGNDQDAYGGGQMSRSGSVNNANNASGSYRQQQVYGGGEDDDGGGEDDDGGGEDDGGVPPPAKGGGRSNNGQRQVYDEAQEDEEEQGDGDGGGGYKQGATYGRGRTEDEFASHGAAHEDEF